MHEKRTATIFWRCTPTEKQALEAEAAEKNTSAQNLMHVRFEQHDRLRKETLRLHDECERLRDENEALRALVIDAEGRWLDAAEKLRATEKPRATAADWFAGRAVINFNAVMAAPRKTWKDGWFPFVAVPTTDGTIAYRRNPIPEPEDTESRS